MDPFILLFVGVILGLFEIFFFFFFHFLEWKI